VVTVSMTEFVDDVVKVVEGTGAAIMVLGGLWLLAEFAISVLRSADVGDAYGRLRRRLGMVILLGLEVLIVGDLIRTIIVDHTLEAAAVLGIVVAIRITLSFALQMELEETAPWSRWRSQPAPPPAEPAVAPATPPTADRAGA
jgi:uncharacterized membrane protein